MKVKNNLMHRLDAITGVISTLFALIVVSTITSAIVFIGLPYLNELHEAEVLEHTENQLNSIIDTINDIVTGDSSEQVFLTVASDVGSVSIDKEKFDRTVVICSHENGFDFDVTGLDPNDEDDYNFDITDGSLATHADIHYLYDEDLPTDENLEIGVDPASYSLNDKIKIDLKDENGDIVGNIWLFDSNSLTFNLPFDDETHELILQKGGILFSDNGIPRVRKMFNINYDGSDLIIHLIQTSASKSASAGGNGFNTKISIESYGSQRQENLDEAYNIKLQLYGDNSETWLEYMFNNNKYGSTYKNGNTLEFLDSSSGKGFTFINSTVDIDIVTTQ